MINKIKFIDQALVYGDMSILVALLVLKDEKINKVEIFNEIENKFKFNKNRKKKKFFYVLYKQFSIENGLMT